MSQASITKTFHFSAAHALPNHEGPCRHLHGHNYQVEVTVSGPVQPTDGEPAEGMVVDFAELTDAYKRLIDAVCDHRLLVQVYNPSVKLHYAAELSSNAGLAHVKIGNCDLLLPAISIAALPIENTTAECLAAWMLDILHQELPGVSAVRVWETPSSSAEVTL